MLLGKKNLAGKQIFLICQHFCASIKVITQEEIYKGFLSGLRFKKTF